MYEIIGIIKLKSEIAVPVWSITHTLETFSSNYLKIQTIRQMCLLFQQGAHDSDFKIAVNSFDLYPTNEQTGYKKPELIVLGSKEDSARDFWKFFGRLHRPVVLFRAGTEFNPIYDIESEMALQIPSLSIESPFSVSLRGTLGAIIDLFTGRAVAVRANEHNTTAIANVRNIVETSHLIENPNTPEGVRRFARDQIDNIINRQARINHKLGIKGRIQ